MPRCSSEQISVPAVKDRNRPPREEYLRIWETVGQIPRGKVATYGAMARLAGLIGQARLVGNALHNLPPRSRVPWHRVVNSGGKISLPRKDGHYLRQKRRLEKEGVLFRDGRIDLNRYGWPRSIGPAHR